MPDIDLTNPIFSDEDKARKHLEAQRWPDGISCPFCGGLDTVSPLKGASMGPGWYHCNACRDKFTVRVGSVMERSHIPLTKWALAFHLMCASKKGASAKQLQRMLGFTSYKSAWFMAMRIRTAMTPSKNGGKLGGEGKVLESDETFVGGKAKNAHKNKFQMLGVFSEFERAMIQERVKAGLARARDEGVTLGRPKLEDADPARAEKVRAMRARGVGVRKIARELGVGVGAVLRLTSPAAPKLTEAGLSARSARS